MHIANFLEEDYTDFAVYRIYQRLPHILDSMGQTQRKILYVLEKVPEAKKIKTAEVYSYVYSQTKYLHGDMSVYNVVENMARGCSNNLNLLTEEGAFGYRTNKTAASPRYTSTRFSKVSRVLFNREDYPIYEEQEFEGTVIEPKFLLPILPPSLINGYSAIAVGFASKFLPRNPTEIIDKTIKALQYRKRKNANWKNYRIEPMQPDFPIYNGQIIHDNEHVDKSAWFLTGVLNKTKRRNILEIVDIPPDSNRESYIKKLKRFQEKGVIKSFSEGCVKNNIQFTVRVSTELWKQSEDELLHTLGLVDKVVENFTFLNPKGNADNTIIKFSTAHEYLKYFISIRQEYYETRRKYQIDELNTEISILKERIRFIVDVNSNDIIITKRKKIDLEKELQDKGYTSIDQSYDYLLGMKMYALTEENIIRFNKNIQDKEVILANLKTTTSEDMHILELKNMKSIIQKEIKAKGLR